MISVRELEFVKAREQFQWMCEFLAQVRQHGLIRGESCHI